MVVGLFGRWVRRGVVAASLLVMASTAPAWSAEQSTDGMWSAVAERNVASTAQARQIVPQRYRTVALDLTVLDKLMARVPAEADVRVANSDSIIELPMVDGEFERFRVVESSIMAPALAAKYPQIRTWVAQGIDDPSATARLDLTPKGFHAQIISWRGTSYVDPYQPDDVEHYIAYRKNDYDSGKQMRCEVEGNSISPKEIADPSQRGVAAKLASGDNLRTYRLAMAATGEYTAYHGGTVIDGLSGIVTTVNRVTGIYEREVSVRFELVANEDQIIFTDAGNDPYTNSGGSSDLTANVSATNSIIGSANYDVGHLVGTGAGGVASLGVICTGSKASGLTGLSNPVGDSFDVDYVAHEMGHQFGGNHTFNGSGGNCNNTNRNGSTAYEPGSGITIQAYAGICGGDNTQPHSEDYFHRLSLNEIIAHTTGGSGSTCGVLTATGNSVPTVTTTPSYTIPQQTPFELTAAGNDGDGDPLTYLWEQFDLGSRNSTGSLVDNGGPLFRSFAPTTSPARAFPSWRYILNNANVPPATAPLPGTSSPSYFTAELLPSTNRTMNFRVTVRDNRAGGGGTNEASTALTVTTSAGPFVVTAPDTAVSWAAGSSQSVTWSVASTNAAPVNAVNVRITLSVDGGNTWPIELAASEANDGSATVTVPANTPATTQARVRVQAVGNVFFDVSNTNFSITNANTAPTVTPSGTAVSIRQGGPSANADVAAVADAQDAAGTLAISVSDAPAEMTVSAINTGGTISLTAQAQCELVAPTSGSRTYPVLLTATDSAGGVGTASVNVNVSANRAPTLGNYTDIAVARSSSTPNAPSAGPTDPDGNFSGMSVSPSTLPGGGTISVAPNGTVTVGTTASTDFGTFTVRVQAEDGCGAVQIKEFDLTVASTEAVLEYDSATVLTGNGIIDPNECNQVEVTLRNAGTVTATGVSAVVSTSTPNVSISQPIITFADIPASQTRTSQVPFEVSTTNSLVCLTDIDFDIDITYGGGSSPSSDVFSLTAGEIIADNYTFASSAGATIAAGGTLAPGSAADDALITLPVPAGFSFSIYGRPFVGGDQILASTNGTLQLTGNSGTNNYTPGALPNDGSGDYAGEFFPTNDPVLLPYWDDLITSTTGGGIYTQVVGSAPNRDWIIEWRGAHYTSSPGATNLVFAVVIHEGSNDFDFVYAQIGSGSGSGGAEAGIGVQAATSGSLFTQYSLNTQSVSAGTKLSASSPAPVCSMGTGACSAIGVTISQSGGNTTATEGGAGDSYTVALTAVPDDTVTINLMADANVQVSTTSLQFTTINWASAQSVTVTAVNDRTVEGTHSGSITHAASGGGADGAYIPDVVAAITDNDSATYQFAAANSSANEAAGSVNLAVSVNFNTSGIGTELLGSPISVPVSINVPGSTAVGGGVDFSLPSSLVIPVEGTSQNIAVTLIDDSIVEGSELALLTLGNETGGGPSQEAVVSLGATASHALTINDSDAPSVSISETGGTTDVDENGAGDSYSVFLDREPSGNVTITATPDAQVEVTPSQLTFTAANWDVPQIINLTAVDDEVVEGPHSGVVGHTASGGAYDGVSIADVMVAITDNDPNADLAISTIASPLFATPGQTVSFEITVNNLSSTVDVPMAQVLVDIVPAMDNPQWTCVADANASCSVSGTGLPSDMVSLDQSTGVMYTVTADMPGGAAPGTSYVATANVTIDPSQQDLNSANNSAQATVGQVDVDVFKDGFESPL